MTAPSFAFNTLTQPSSTTVQAAPSGFSTSTALLLAQACSLAYTQFAQGAPLTDSQVNSALTALPGTTYTLVATLTGPEALGPGASSVGVGAYTTVPFGFALQASQGNTPVFNVIALRGTLTFDEWLEDISAMPVGFNLDTVDSKAYVHGGFYGAYTTGTGGTKASSKDPRPAGSLAAQVQQAMASLLSASSNTALPLYVTGHSLGAALSVLCAMDVAVNFSSSVSSGGLGLYSFACPRVAAGLMVDGIALSSPSAFVTNFQKQVPANFHVENAADLVPFSPPTSLLFGDAGSQSGVTFSQVFTSTVTYCAQLGGLAANHSLADNYLQYVTQLSGGFTLAVPRARQAA